MDTRHRLWVVFDPDLCKSLRGHKDEDQARTILSGAVKMAGDNHANFNAVLEALKLERVDEKHRYVPVGTHPEPDEMALLCTKEGDCWKFAMTAIKHPTDE